MEIIKIEDYRYSIIYTNDNGKNEVHKRMYDGTWKTLNGDKWQNSDKHIELEKAFSKKK
jgi:hypothetical protein